jgi:hypothetical protein
MIWVIGILAIAGLGSVAFEILLPYLEQRQAKKFAAWSRKRDLDFLASLDKLAEREGNTLMKERIQEQRDKALAMTEAERIEQFWELARSAGIPSDTQTPK